MFTTPAPRGGPTYREFIASLGPLGARVPSVYAGFGLAEPQADRPMRDDEVSVIRRFLMAWDAVDPGGDSDVRVARLSRRDKPADDGGLAGRLGRGGPTRTRDAGRPVRSWSAGRPERSGPEPIDQRRRARPRPARLAAGAPSRADVEPADHQRDRERPGRGRPSAGPTFAADRRRVHRPDRVHDVDRATSATTPRRRRRSDSQPSRMRALARSAAASSSCSGTVC